MTDDEQLEMCERLEKSGIPLYRNPENVALAVHGEVADRKLADNEAAAQAAKYAPQQDAWNFANMRGQTHTHRELLAANLELQNQGDAIEERDRLLGKGRQDREHAHQVAALKAEKAQKVAEGKLAEARKGLLAGLMGRKKETPEEYAAAYCRSTSQEPREVVRYVDTDIRIR
jgi:hypothetical protein